MLSLKAKIEAVQGEGIEKIRQLFYTVLPELEALKTELLSEDKSQRHEARNVLLTFFRIFMYEIAKEKEKTKKKEQQIIQEVFHDPKLNTEDIDDLYILINYCFTTVARETKPPTKKKKKQKKKFFA